MLEKFSIRSQILGSFTIIATLSWIIISTLTLGNIALVGDTTGDLATDALDDQVKRNMLLTSRENARIIENKAYNAEAIVRSLSNAAEQLFSNDPGIAVYNYKESFLDLNISNIPGVTNNGEYNNKLISTFASSYYSPK